VRASVKQAFDERFQIASARAYQISGVVTAFLLLVCGVVFMAQQNITVGWLFIGGAYLTIFGGLLLTQVFLRRV